MIAHPDKNNNSEASTLEFQKLSAAMHEVQRFHETPTNLCPCGRDHDQEEEEDDDGYYVDPRDFLWVDISQLS